MSQLLALIRIRGHDTLIPTDDQTLTAVTEHHADLINEVNIACPPPEITSNVLNKLSTLRIAEACGLRIPNTMLISDSAQLLKLRSSLPFPWILKPARKEIGVEEVKSTSLASPDEVAAKFTVHRSFAPPMLLQEYCPGAGVGVEILMHDGDPMAVFQHRRIKEQPHTGGVSVTAVAEGTDHTLLEQSVTLLRKLRWEGPAMVEFKINADNGDAVLMEVNGRYWGTISLPIRVGINFPLYHWQLLHQKRPVVPRDYASGTTWRWTAGHVFRLHGLLIASRHSNTARKELLRSILDLPNLFAGSSCDAIFSSADPMPAILDVLQAGHFLLLDDIKSLGRVLRRSTSKNVAA